MDPLLVGLDVGTTTSKAIVFTTDGRPVSEGKAVTPWVITPHGAEMDANALLASAREALRSAVAAAPPCPIVGVGVTSMGESGVLLNGHGEPLAPVIAWHDTRDGAEVANLTAALGEDTFAGRTGLPLRGQWSLTKHRWLLAHHPQTKEAVRRLNVAEWIIRGLGGEESAEQSLASRTGWLDLKTRDWWAEALEWSGAGRSLMPDLVTSGTPLGTVSESVGIQRLTGAVFTVCGHDHQAASVGAGAAGPGDELDSCGTAEALVRTVPAGVVDTAAVQALAKAGITTGWHVLADHWCLLGGTQGGLALQRVLSLLGRTSADVADLDRDALARERSGIVVSAEDDDLRISGVTNGLGPADLWRAALEAVTAQANRIHSAMSAVVGNHESLVVTGGFSRSKGLLEVKRRVLGPLRNPEVSEAGARGAALLSGIAAGVYAGREQFPPLEQSV